MRPRWLAVLVASSLALPAAAARTVKIDYDVTFNMTYDFATETFKYETTFAKASVFVDVDATSLRDKAYWDGQLQLISTYFGKPTIISDFAASLPRPADSASWTTADYSFSLASNIDYSVSWPETPLGKGPFVTYQMNDGFYGYKGQQTWNYIVGFNLGRPEFQVADIRQLTGDEILSYIQRSEQEHRQFTTGFNSFVFDNVTHKNLYGASYQGTAVITGVQVLSAVPEPTANLCLLAGIGLLTVNVARRKKGR